VLENRVLRKIFGPTRSKVTGSGKHYIMRRLMTKKERGMKQVWGTGGAYTGFLWGYLMERDHLEDLGVDGRIILKCIKMWGREAWTDLIWLRIRRSDKLL